MASPYKIEHLADITVISMVPDPVFYEKHDQFLKDLKIIVGKTSHRFILDMGSVDYMSSLMLSALVHIHQLVVQNDGEFILCNINKRVLDVMTIMHLDSLFVITPNRASAMESFSSGIDPTRQFRRQLSSRLESIPTAINESIEFLKQYISLNDDQVFDVRLVLEEALSNAIRHGNKSDPQRMVDLNVSIEEGDVRVVVRNEGEGFDPTVVPDPTLPTGLTRTSGRGVFLIRKIMDKVVYSDKGRCLTMIKSF